MRPSAIPTVSSRSHSPASRRQPDSPTHAKLASAFPLPNRQFIVRAHHETCAADPAATIRARAANHTCFIAPRVALHRQCGSNPNCLSLSNAKTVVVGQQHQSVRVAFLHAQVSPSCTSWQRFAVSSPTELAKKTETDDSPACLSLAMPPRKELGSGPHAAPNARRELRRSSLPQSKFRITSYCTERFVLRASREGLRELVVEIAASCSRQHWPKRPSNTRRPFLVAIENLDIEMCARKPAALRTAVRKRASRRGGPATPEVQAPSQPLTPK